MAAIRRAIANQPLTRRALLRRPVMLGLCASTIILLLGVIAARLLAQRGSDVERGTSALVAAFSHRRLIESRLSGGFKASPFNPDASDRSGIDDNKLDKGRELVTNAAANGDAQAQLAYGRVLLLDGKHAAALHRIRAAVKGLPSSAEAHNDLGVCLLEQGNLEEALDEFDAASQCNAQMPEASFNRALCYRRLMLRDMSKAEYESAVANERDRGWIDEITRRKQEAAKPLAPRQSETLIVAALDAAMASNSIDEAKRIVGEQFESMWRAAIGDLPIEYLKQATAGNAGPAQRALDEIKLIGAEFEARMGDSSLNDLAEYLSKLSFDDQQIELKLISEYGEAQTAFSRSNYSAGQTEFARLRGLFKAQGNRVFELFAINDLATCLSSGLRLAASVETLQAPIAEIDEHRWPFCKAILLVSLAAAHSRLGEDSNAIRDCQRALKLFGNAPRRQAKVFQTMGLAYRHLGDLENALARFNDSTKLLLDCTIDPAELAYNYLSGADLQRLRGYHSLALLYAEEAIKFSESPNRTAQALSFAAIERARLEQFDQAQKQLDAAQDYLAKIGDSGQRLFTEHLVLTRAAELAEARGDLPLSIQCYSKAKALLEKSEGGEISLINVLCGRAEAYTSAGQFNNARNDLDQAISGIEQTRSKITDATNRSDYLDASHGVFDQMILLSVRRAGGIREAFDFSEQSRARTLLDELSLQGSKEDGRGDGWRGGLIASSGSAGKVIPLELVQVQRALPEDMTLLTYSVTDQGTLIFVVTRSACEVVESPATTQKLDRLVNDYVSRLKSKASEEDLTEKARELYGDLIAPVESKLGAGKRLCVVPDKALHFLPFAALVDGSGRYLMSSYYLTSAPSASALIQCIKASAEKNEAGEERILAIGNPDFDRSEFTTLEDLPDAELEAKRCALLYGANSVLLTGANATKARLLDEIKDCEVVHLAAHCVVDEKSPTQAAIVLAAPGKNSGQLSAAARTPAADGLLSLNEINGLSLPKTKLVVLSACQSGLGRYYRGEGLVSLVRPFLALRVPAVVASLWSVDSQATASLMIEFHRQRKSRSASAGEALSYAQNQMASSKEFNHPYYWAPFTVIGYGN